MEHDPMVMQTANAKTIPCRDCIYRDRASVVIGGERMDTGITKDTCMIFDGKGGRWKPNSVYFHSRPCEFYAKDDEA